MFAETFADTLIVICCPAEEVSRTTALHTNSCRTHTHE